MPLIQIPVGIAPCHVDFPDRVKTGGKDAKGKAETRELQRSCKGSLYLRPASTRNVTDDELTYLRISPEWKKIGTRLHVVKVKSVKSAAEEKNPSQEPATMPEAPKTRSPEKGKSGSDGMFSASANSKRNKNR